VQFLAVQGVVVTQAVPLDVAPCPQPGATDDEMQYPFSKMLPVVQVTQLLA